MASSEDCTGGEASAAERDPCAAERDPCAAERDPSATERDPSATERDPSATERDPSLSASPTAEAGKLCCGRCKWFDVSKGYGFVTPDDKTGDIFVYQANIHMNGFRSLEENEVVEFTYQDSEQGREAKTVTGPGGACCKGSKRKGRGKRRRDDRCYNCNEHGHHAKNCPEPPLPKRCHHCKSEDHLVADCPDKPAQSSQGSGAKSSDNGHGSTNGDEGASSEQLTSPNGGSTS